MKLFILCALTFLASVAVAQSAATATDVHSSDGPTTSPAPEIPSRMLEFKSVKSSIAPAVSPVTTLPPQCVSDGSLFLDSLDPKDLTRHTVISIQADRSQQYLPSAIQGLNDISVMNFFPSDSVVGFLVRATKEPAGAPGPGKSPAGVAWKDYHYYIAEFNRDGSFDKSIELPADYTFSRFAIMGSGEFLVAAYDRLNSAAHLLVLDQSGKKLRELDYAPFRTAPDGNAAFGSAQSLRNSSKLMGSVLFTPYREDILVWRINSSDPVLDVSSGGNYREVPIQAPAGMTFANMVAANDRWVALFRSKSVADNKPLNQADYSYFEVDPIDGGLGPKLTQSRDVPPRYLWCERDGTYTSFERDKAGDFVLLKAN